MLNECMLDLQKIEVPRYEQGAIGMPAVCVPFTNSERKTAWCPHRWLLKNSTANLDEPSRALARGRALHAGLEAMFRYFQLSNGMTLPAAEWDSTCPLCLLHGTANPTCSVCQGTQMGIVGTAMWAAFGEASISEDEKELEGIRRSLHGYVARWGIWPLGSWRVVGVEQAFAAPIRDQDDCMFTTEIPLVKIDDFWTMCTAPDQDVVYVRMPWYQLGRLDVVLQHSDHGSLLVHEFKTSVTPSSFSRDLAVDTQMPGYMSLLSHHAHRYGASRVSGYQYDVLTSKGWARPRVLKSGKFSTAAKTQANVPSWAWHDALTDEQRKKHTDREWELLQEMRRASPAQVDDRLYCREFGTFNDAEMRRYRAELYADARMFAAWRSYLPQRLFAHELASRFPRRAVCRIRGHSCDFIGSCIRGDADSRMQSVSGIKWFEAKQEEEKIECPF